MNLTANPLPKTSLSSLEKSQNLNLNILNMITQPKPILSTNKPKNIPNLSLNDLSEILKQKNHKLQAYRHQKQQVRDWLKDKGVNFNKIQQQVKNSAKIAEEIQTVILPKKQIKQLTRQELRILSQSQKQAYLDALEAQRQLTQTKWSFKPQTQEQFIKQKQKQNSINLTILKSSNLEAKNKTQQLLISKIRKILPNSNFSYNNINFNNATNLNKTNTVNEITKQFQKYSFKQNSKKRQKYFQFVQQLCINGFNQNTLNKLKSINSFWQITLKHITTIQTILTTYLNQSQTTQQSQLQSQISTQLSIQSLTLLQKKYSQQTPDYYKINKNIKNQFKHLQQQNKNLSIYRNQQGQPIWVLAYYLLRSNNIGDLRKVLNKVDKVYIQEIIKYQQSIQRGQPRPSMKGFDINRYKDKFYKQIVFILKGMPMFQADINDIDVMNKIWIILKTLAIYRYIPEKAQQYDQILDSLFQKQTEKCKSITKSSIQQYLYLTAYKQTLRFCQININKRKLEFSQDFNNDDYFHFVMIVSYYPQLCGYMDQEQKRDMQQKFTQFLLQYIEILYRQQHYKIIPSYLLLSPPQQLQSIAFKFINSREKYLKFSWFTLKQLLIERDQQNGLQTYQQLSLQILKNIKLSTFYDYKFVAEEFRTRFYKQKQSVFRDQQYSVMILLKKLYFGQKKKFYQMLNSYDSNQLMSFFDIQNQDKLQEKQKQLLREVRRCEQLLEYKKCPQYENDIQYYKKVTMPYQFYLQFTKLTLLIKSNNLRQLKNFTSTFLINSQTAHLTQTNPHPTPILLLQSLQSQSSPITSLYVFYLLSLIKRQQILCAQNCDYYSFNEFKIKVLEQIEILQNYHYNIVKLSCQPYNQLKLKGWQYIMTNIYPQLLQYQFKKQSQNQQQMNKISQRIYNNPLGQSDQYRIFKRELEEQININRRQQ